MNGKINQQMKKKLNSVAIVALGNSFNEFILADPEVRESSKLPILKEVQKNYIKLIIFWATAPSIFKWKDIEK